MRNDFFFEPNWNDFEAVGVDRYIFWKLQLRLQSIRVVDRPYCKQQKLN